MLNNKTVSLWRIWLVPVLFAIGSATASATQITAGVEWSLGGVAGANSPDIDGPASSGSVDVLGSDADANGNSIFYHTYGNTTGTFGSRTSGTGVFDIAGEFNFSGNFVNPGPGSAPASFTFEVIPGEISANAFGLTLSGSDMLFARYELDIRLNGVSIWDSSAEITNTASGIAFTETGTNSLGGAFSGSRYFWNTFTDTLSLGVFDAGSPFLIEYDLRTFARGNINTTRCDFRGERGGRDDEPRFLDRFFEDEIEGEIDGEFGFGCGEAIARIGDPFSPTFGSTGTVNGAVPVNVPEPASVLLLGLGMVGLARRQRC